MNNGTNSTNELQSSNVNSTNQSLPMANNPSLPPYHTHANTFLPGISGSSSNQSSIMPNINAGNVTAGTSSSGHNDLNSQLSTLMYQQSLHKWDMSTPASKPDPILFNMFMNQAQGTSMRQQSGIRVRSNLYDHSGPSSSTFNALHGNAASSSSSFPFTTDPMQSSTDLISHVGPSTSNGLYGNGTSISSIHASLAKVKRQKDSVRGTKRSVTQPDPIDIGPNLKKAREKSNEKKQNKPPTISYSATANSSAANMYMYNPPTATSSAANMYMYNPPTATSSAAISTLQQSTPQLTVNTFMNFVIPPVPATLKSPKPSVRVTPYMPYVGEIRPAPKVTAAVPHPPNWLENIEDTVMSLNTYKKYVVNNSTAEYQTISDMLYPTQISVVERIVNHELWERFTKTRGDMLKSKIEDDVILRKLGLDETGINRRLHASYNFTKDPLLIPYSDNMVLLFHCTRNQANVESILSQGLDERLSSINGGLLGKGIYFSDNPRKSIQYDRTGTIFIFAVLLGDCISVDHIPGKNAFVREPEKVNQQKRNHNDLFFDSIVARPGGDNEYVIYNRYQCCPLYQIQHKHGAEQAGGSSYYNIAAQNLPPLAWLPSDSNYAMPIQNQNHYWPFFAVDIFKMMGARPPTDDDEDERLPPEVSQPSIDDNLASLINLGYDNEDSNREILAKFNNDLQQTVNYMLDNEIVEDRLEESIVEELLNVTSLGNSSTSSLKERGEQPSIIIIDDDDDIEAINHLQIKSSTKDDTIATPNEDDKTTKNDSKPSISKMKIEEDLPEDIADWALEYYDQKTTETEECPICCNDYNLIHEAPSSWQILECSHKLCTACYSKLLTTRVTMTNIQHTFVKCPFCQGTSGIEIGTCPDMQMKVSTHRNSCEGYSPAPTFVIDYTAPNFHRTAYIPNNVEGQEALRCLQIAFDRRLCFTIGTSNTTGQNNAIVWNIHHKTSLNGGVYKHGFPDPDYLNRLRWELSAFGIE